MLTIVSAMLHWGVLPMSLRMKTETLNTNVTYCYCLSTKLHPTTQTPGVADISDRQFRTGPTPKRPRRKHVFFQTEKARSTFFISNCSCLLFFNYNLVLCNKADQNFKSMSNIINICKACRGNGLVTNCRGPYQQSPTCISISCTSLYSFQMCG